jgi:hypothetical protein
MLYNVEQHDFKLYIKGRMEGSGHDVLIGGDNNKDRQVSGPGKKTGTSQLSCDSAIRPPRGGGSTKCLKEETRYITTYKR